MLVLFNFRFLNDPRLPKRERCSSALVLKCFTVKKISFQSVNFDTNKHHRNWHHLVNRLLDYLVSQCGIAALCSGTVFNSDSVFKLIS